MKVTVFNGSPRGKQSNSHKMVEAILAGAGKAGAQTSEVFLVEQKIAHCKGCFACWLQTPGKCSIRDDMDELLEQYFTSDYVGFATPVYGMLMTGILKDFTDRMLPLSTPQIHKNEDGSFYHEGRLKRFPRMFYVANSGFPGSHNFDLLKPYVGMLSCIFEVYRNCGEILSDPRGAAAYSSQIDAFYDALKQAGEAMVSCGAVSQELVEKIHLPLISDEEYMAEANRDLKESSTA